MQFRIADSFVSSLARLSAAEQKAAKTTAFDLQVNADTPGLRFHKIDRVKDKNFWSVRVSQDIRIIVHRMPGSLLLCYVDHHDKAYGWAERRRLETHPTTGAAQFVEIRERVQEVANVKRVAEPAAAYGTLPFAAIPDAELLRYGVPTEWLAEVRAATENTILSVADHLPAEAAEAVLELAIGRTPHPSAANVARVSNPFDHPDAQRRFRVMTDVEELTRALESPWDRWTVFLHPAQRELVERTFDGPARVAGSAGTGKTIVALHRAAHLARGNRDARVLLATFSDSLASALRVKLGRLIGVEPRIREAIDVSTLDTIALRLYKSRIGSPKVATSDDIHRILEAAARERPESKFSQRFLLKEWIEVVDAWQLHSWEAYRDVARLGRKTRLAEKQRELLWSIFAEVRQGLDESRLITQADLLDRLTRHIRESGQLPYDFVVIDEAQDVSVAQLRFLAALGAGQPNRLFFAGDLGQRIFQIPFSWRSLGVDIQGRSTILRVNYRTSHQIRTQADCLLSKELADVDGYRENRAGTVSVFNGPPPVVSVVSDQRAETMAVADWLTKRIQENVAPEDMVVLVRSASQVARARAAIEGAGLQSVELDGSGRVTDERVGIATMHQSKGLEFRAVAVMACDDEVLPLQERIESISDDADLEDVYDTERELLYVACTRARDHLMVSGVAPASEFLRDILP